MSPTISPSERFAAATYRGHLPKEQVTLAKMLKSRGYVTGHHKAIFSGYHGNAELYHLAVDPAESTSIAEGNPEKIGALREVFRDFEASAEASHRGDDYSSEFQATEPCEPLHVS